MEFPREVTTFTSIYGQNSKHSTLHELFYSSASLYARNIVDTGTYLDACKMWAWLAYYVISTVSLIMNNIINLSLLSTYTKMQSKTNVSYESLYIVNVYL